MSYGDRISNYVQRPLEASDNASTSKKLKGVKDSNAEFSKRHWEDHERESYLNESPFKATAGDHDPSREEEHQYRASIIEHGRSNSVRATAGDQPLSIYDRSRTSMQPGESSGAGGEYITWEDIRRKNGNKSGDGQYSPHQGPPLDSNRTNEYHKTLENITNELKELGLLSSSGEVNERYSVPFIWKRKQTIMELQKIEEKLNQMVDLTTTTNEFLDRVRIYRQAISKALK